MAIEDETTGPRLLAVMWTMSGVALVFMMLRYIFKHRSGKKFYIDDWLLAISWLCLVLYSTFITTGTRYGMGRHLTTLAHEDVVEAHRFLAVSYFFGTIGKPLSKTSFAITLLRLAPERWQRGFIIGIIITTNVFLWISATLLFTSCKPVEKIFNPKLPGTCLNPKAILRYNQFSAGKSVRLPCGRRG
jgi:energy-coupling factor transporter transmembrane protein EcfT